MAAPRPWLTEYQVTSVDVVFETHGIRVLDACFDAGQQVPWHTHSEVVDHFWVLEGRLRIETAAPATRHELGAGAYLRVPPGQPHRVTALGEEPCRFLNLQGHGAYDFTPVEGAGPDRATGQ